MKSPPVELGQAAEEIKRLERCLTDLVALVALPAMWAGARPSFIAGDLVETLAGMLVLDLAFLRLADPATGTPVEVARVAPGWQLPARAHAVGIILDMLLGTDPPQEPVRRRRLGPRDLSFVALPVGRTGELGVLIAGSARPDFPSETERLLLTVARNQALMAMQDLRLLSEQRRCR